MKHLKLLLTLLMGVLCSADLMADVVTWTSGDITATFDGSTLTISGQGAIPDFSNEFDYSLWRDGYYRGDINNIVIEDGVTRIGNYAFAGCYYFSSITIPSSATSIGKYAFYQCETLTSIEFPEGGTSSLTSIGESAFYNCEALASVTIPEGVTSIKRNTFGGCKNLASISIPETVTSIGEYAFFDCEALASVTIPEGVTSIERHTFCRCKNLASISIPETVTSIGSSAFSDCEALASVTIPEGVTYIESYTFDGCKNLASITIPETVTYIGEYAFYNCEALASVTIPEGVTSIRDYAFCLSDMRLFPVIYCWADPEKLLLGEGAVNCHDFYVNAKYQVKYMDIANAYRNLRPLSVIGFLNEEEDYSELLDNSLDEIIHIGHVALGRTFISGYYYTFSVPFDMEMHYLNRGFGESNCVVKKLASSKIDNDNILTMTFEDLGDYDYIEANKPYLIKVKKDVVNPVFDRIMIPGENNYNPSTSCVDFVSSSKGKTLVYGYDGSDDVMSVLFLGSGNKLFNPMVVSNPDDPNSYIKGFRGYFQVHPEVQQNIRAYQMNFGDEESTGIQMLNVDEEISGAATGIYTLDGRCLNDMPTEKGLYIVNGKKVMIK